MSSTTVPPIDVVAPGLQTRLPGGALAGPARACLLTGAVALGASLVGLALGPETRKQFFFSYLTAYGFALGLCLGALFFVMLQHIYRAGWSVIVRRSAENLMGVMPYMAVLFLPIALGFETLYHHWVHPIEGDAVIAGKRGYLNPTFFFVRIGIYFVIWIGLASWFRRTSLSQDQNGDPQLTLKMSRRAAPGILLFALTTTFASIDLFMSLDPHWFSTMWGVYMFAGYVLSTIAVLTLACLFLQRQGYLRDAVNSEHYHDLGKLLFAFTVFWAYITFSQYMLIWYANLPEETSWFAERKSGAWYLVGQILIVGHFLVPFAFLMSRHVKRTRPLLALGAVLMLVMHQIDLHWIVMPALHGHSPHLHWLDATTFVGLLALVFGLFLNNVRSTPLLPERDPRLVESLQFHNI
ncbi:MAG: hypothetical protein IT458_09930 [Planctomycetes bacterium]|nr:hypothetical protein [Planctomycetota bacterium]